MKRKEVGDVYAIHTSKGEAIVQVCAEDRDIDPTLNITQIRVFAKLHNEIPQQEELEILLQGEEDYRIFCVVSTMTSKKYNMATKLGKFNLPKAFKPSQYLKYTLCRRIQTELKQTRWWTIHLTGKDFLYYYGLKLTDWIENYLHMDSKKEEWKEVFKKLDVTSIYNGLGIIEDLESGFNPRNFLPDDLETPSKNLIKEVD